MTHKEVSVHRGEDGVVYTNSYSDNRDPKLDPVPCHEGGCQVCLLKEIRDELIASRHAKEGIVGPDTRPPPPKPLLPDPVARTVEKGIVSAGHTSTSSAAIPPRTPKDGPGDAKL